ncbi:hypothetical protein WAB17_07485 [Parerythrobacter aurantius]|uniref:hypothetical protein n=1 Tax=Parerythrobacter aurantius TaxID=3127706 RepID=UPI0032474C0A
MRQNRILDQLVRFGSRYERPLGWLAAAWFVIGCVAAAGFVDLPRIPFLTDRNAWMVSAPVNALWWGWLRPELQLRKAALADAPEARP